VAQKLDLAFQVTANADGMAAGVARADRELAKVGASSKATAAEFRQAAKITQELRTPTEKYADTIGKLDSMLQKGLLTQEVYGRAVSKADAELKAATSSADQMAKQAGIAERVINGLSNAIRGVGDATKSVADAGISVIAFGKDIAWTAIQWKIFSAIRNPAGLKDFAIGALKGAMTARTMILAAKALGVGLAVSGGAAGTTAAALLGLSNPMIGATLLAFNLGKSFLAAKDRALEMAAAITQGTVTLEQLNAELGQVQAQQVDNLAFSMEEATAAGERSGKAFSGLGDVFVTPFVGAFAAIQSGMAGLTNGISSVVEGITSVLSPIAETLAPVLTLIGTLVEFVLKLVGVFGQLLGAVLKVAGAAIRVFLSPFIVGWSNFVEMIRQGMGSVFSYISGFFDKLDGRIQKFYSFMSKVPLIGRAFASGPSSSSAAASGPAAAMEETASAAESADEEMKAAEDTMRRIQEQSNAASSAAVEFGQAGFDAAAQYQQELRALQSQFEAGMFNEAELAARAEEAKKKYDEQIDSIRERNKALAEQAEEDRKAEQDQQAAMTRQTDAFFAATKNAEQFGEAGKRAADQYMQGLMDLNEQLRDGRINEEQYNREADKLKGKFDSQTDAMKKAQEIGEDVAKKQEEIDKIQADKAAALGGKSNEALKANDIRSSEGMAQFIALATGREDPAIEENRKTNAKLEEIRKELAALQQQQVDILGAAA
jgi:hypothetical protein